MNEFEIKIFDIETTDWLDDDKLNFVPRCGDYICVDVFHEGSHNYRIKEILIKGANALYVFVDRTDEFILK